MVDIVYVVGKGAKGIDDKPLRWSLRSVEKFAKNVGRVIVAGYPPEWLSDEVIKVPFEQTHRKHLNMLLSIAEAAKQAQLKQPFLFSSDDHYFCKEADLEKWPRYHYGNLPSLKTWKRKHKGKKERPTNYSMNLFQTRFLLREAGLPIRMCGIHIDAWIDPHDIDAAVEFSMKYEQKCKLGVEPLCLLEALYEKRLNSIGVEVKYTQYTHDSKVHNVAEAEKKIELKRPMFSTSPEAETDSNFIAWMDNFFQKSKYEK